MVVELATTSGIIKREERRSLSELAQMGVGAGGWTGSGSEKGAWAGTERLGAPGSGVQSLHAGLAGAASAPGAD